MEKDTFTDKGVRATFENFVVSELYVDSHDGADIAAKNTELRNRLSGSEQLPAYVVIDPITETVVGVWGYSREFLSDPSSFSKKLEAAKEAVELLQKK